MMKPPSALTLLPIILMASLMTTACQDTRSSVKHKHYQDGDIAQDAAGTQSNRSDMSTAHMTDKMTELSSEKAMSRKLSLYRWTLMRATDHHDRPLTSLMNVKDQVSLWFHQYQGQNNLSYSVGCNTMSAGYRLQAHTILTGASMSTKLSCGTLDDAERQLDALMQGPSELSLFEGREGVLTQVTHNSETLVWQGQLTPQAKYHSKGDTLFWAVNAKKVACAAHKMCLQVKPVTYDEQGIKTHEGIWTLFAGTIDGYQHNTQQNEVLRLQRYLVRDHKLTTPNVPSKAHYAYVLDAVIESGVVQ